MLSLIWFTIKDFIWFKKRWKNRDILMSLPPHVQWVYDHHPGREEEKLVNVLENQEIGYSLF
jgi:coproporphyrinogen III oxidase